MCTPSHKGFLHCTSTSHVCFSWYLCVYFSCSKVTGSSVLEGSENGKAKKVQGKERAGTWTQGKGKGDGGMQRTNTASAVAKGQSAGPTKAPKKTVGRAQGQSVDKKHDGVVSRLLHYQAHQQSHLLFNYETAGPWFEEVSQKGTYPWCAFTPCEPSAGTSSGHGSLYHAMNSSIETYC